MKIQLANLITLFFAAIAGLGLALYVFKIQALAMMVQWHFADPIGTFTYVMAGLIAFGIIGAATAAALSSPINWWYNTRYPPQLDAAGVQVLMRTSAYYRQLSITEKKRFGSRLELFFYGKTFKSEGTPDDEVPEEVKIMVAAGVVQFTFGWQEFWLPELEKTIVYPNLFPTRERNAFHAGEAHSDGCIILSAELLREGLNNAAQYYHIGLHTVCELWLLCHPTDENMVLLGESPTVFLEKTQQIRGFRANYWEDMTGLTAPPILPIAVEAFFAKPAAFKTVLPDAFSALCEWLNQNPLKDTYPVINKSV
jgi:Mlc titration factor MtfA (ptsG expression regulator)